MQAPGECSPGEHRVGLVARHRALVCPSTGRRTSGRCRPQRLRSVANNITTPTPRHTASDSLGGDRSASAAGPGVSTVWADAAALGPPPAFFHAAVGPRSRSTRFRLSSGPNRQGRTLATSSFRTIPGEFPQDLVESILPGSGQGVYELRPHAPVGGWLARIIRGGLDSDTSGVWKVAGVGLRWT